MTLIRRTHPGDVNLPPRIGSVPVDVVIHRSGPLAGHTTLTGPDRALRTPPGAPGWKPMTSPPEAEGERQVMTRDEWAAEIVSGTVNEVRDALSALDASGYALGHVEALKAAEAARGKPRAGVMAAILGWAEGVPA